MTWTHAIKLKDLFPDSEDRNTIVAAIPAIAHRLRTEAPAIRNSEARRSVLGLADVLELAASQDDPKAAANRALQRLYDIADEYRIWID